MRAARPGAGGDRDLAGHPCHPPSSGRTRRWPGRPRDRSWLPRGGGPQHHGPDLDLSGLGRQLHHASRGAADHGRGVPTGQRDDAPARAEGRQRPEERMAYLAELAHHRRHARARGGHPHAHRARPSSSPADPQARDDDRADGTGQRAAEPSVHGMNPPCTAGAQSESSATAGSTGEAKPPLEVLVTPRSANIPRTEGAPSATGKPIPQACRPRMSWLRALPLLAQPITRTMPWVTLISGCLAGTAFLAAMARVADTSRSPLDLGTVRLAFLPAIAALAFVPRAPFRPLTQATPVPAWLAPAGHIALAAPVLAVTCWAQLRIAAHTIPPHTYSHLPAISP